MTLKRLAPALALLAASAVAVPVSAQVALTGQIRPRMEVRDPSGPDAVTQGLTSIRTRLAAKAVTAGGATGFIQLQDVRLFGEEANTLTDYSADGLDLHQGWILIGSESEGSSLKVGRQEIALGGERLVGAVGWAQQGRAFDGARARFHTGSAFRLDLVGAQLQESQAPARSTDALFWAAYGTVNPGGPHALDLYGMMQVERAPAGDTEQWTAGARHVGTAGTLTWRFEGTAQGGTRQGRDVAAFMVAGRAGTSVGRGSLTLWYDYLSGTEAGSREVGAFETLYATNHKYYGFADLFTNIPAHTQGRGLQDMVVKAMLPVGSAWTLAADLHRFLVAEDAGLTSGHLADELDLTLSRRLPSGVVLTSGLSYVWQGDALRPVRGIGKDVLFGYVMLDLTF